MAQKPKAPGKPEKKPRTPYIPPGTWLFIAMLAFITLAGYALAAGTGNVCENIAKSEMSGLMAALTKPVFLCP